MKYAFMREFDGVPLEQTEAEKRATRSAFLRTANLLFSRYVDATEVDDRRGSEITFTLDLHDPAANELVTFCGIADNDGVSDVVGLTLADTVHASGQRTSSTYRSEPLRVVRSQHEDHDAALGMLDSEGLDDFERLLDGRPLPPKQEHSVDMSAFALGTDAVDATEIAGLHAYFEQKNAGGLYVPISSMEAVELM
ncbi:MAG TPA: hypothetical protein VLF62_04570 [Candidatus Saccharimonadales bacterium]|nr:hypothetical protein [Candidatus Saccharimonadales bacterium]